MSATLPHRFDGPADAPHTDGLLLLNGGAMSMAAWEPVMAGLAQLRVLRCDLRGQLLCPLPPPATIEEHADDVAALLDHVGLPSVHVAGTSYGAFVAMALAARHPDRVRSLSLVTTSEVLTPEMHEASVKLREAAAGAARGEVAAAREVFDGLVAFAYSEPYRQRNAELLAARRAAADRLPRVWFEGLVGLFGALLAFDPAPHLRAVRAPTLVVGAAADAVFPLEHSRALAELTRAQLEIVEGSGHALVVEQPQLLAALLADFVAAADNGAKA
ncbi:MAG: alpha/beta hydrolase [Vicinamibacteria bacterium]|nr:alpha/beta hydrolase [Vicinamibacteria bacterium]